MTITKRLDKGSELTHEELDENFRHLAARVRDRPVRVATFGDSTADVAGSGFTNVSALMLTTAFPSSGTTVVSAVTDKLHLQSIYGQARFVANGGIGGDTTTGMLARDNAQPSASRKSISDVLDLDPDVILLRGGSINDLTAVTSANMAATVQAVFDRHMNIIARLRSSGCCVIDSGIAGYSTTDHTDPAATRTALLTLNQMWRDEIAGIPGVRFINPVGLLCGSDGHMLTGVSLDGKHLSMEGALRLAEAEAAIIEELFGQASGPRYRGRNLITGAMMATTSTSSIGAVASGYSIGSANADRQNAKVERIRGIQMQTSEYTPTGASTHQASIYGPCVSSSMSISRGDILGMEVYFYAEALDGQPIGAITSLAVRADMTKTSSGRIVHDAVIQNYTPNLQRSVVFGKAIFPMWRWPEETISLSASNIYVVMNLPNTTRRFKLGLGVPRIVVVPPEDAGSPSTASGLSHRSGEPSDIDGMGLKSEFQWTPVTIPSPYSPGHVLHPSVLRFAGGWNGYKYWMAFTPYPNADSQMENPCVCASNDGINWIPMGPRPLVSSPGVGGYNSDTELAYDAMSDRILMVFRRAEPADGIQKLYIMSTSNGVSWTNYSQIYASTNAESETSTDIMSPSLVFNGSTWEIWGILSRGPSGVNNIAMISTSGMDPLSGWSQTPTTITLAPPSGRDWWHMQVRRLSGGAYLALIQDNNGTSGSIGDLYVAYSHNGVDWSSRLFDSGGQRGYAWYRPSFLVSTDDSNEAVVDVYGSRLNTSTLFYQRCRIQRPSRYPARAFEIAAAISGSALGGIGGFLAADGFNRADSSTSLGSTVDGKVWTQDTGIIGVSGGRAYNTTTGNNRAYIDVGKSNYIVSCVFSTTAGAGSWLVLRYLNGSNYCRVGRNTTSDQIRWQTIVAGAITTNQQLGATPVDGDEIAVSCIGGEYVVYLNGSRLEKVFHTPFMSHTRVGIQMAGSAGYLDNFVVQSIY